MLRFHFLLDPNLDPESYPEEPELESCDSGSMLDPNPALDSDPGLEPDPPVDPNPLQKINYLALFWNHHINLAV